MYSTGFNSSQSPKIKPAAVAAVDAKPAAVAAPPTTEHFQGNPITISISILSGQQFDFEFDRNDTVKTVKEKIQNKLPSEYQ